MTTKSTRFSIHNLSQYIGICSGLEVDGKKKGYVESKKAFVQLGFSIKFKDRRFNTWIEVFLSS